MKSDIEIAREVSLRKIKEIATGLGIPREEVQNYGRYIAKIPIHLIDEEKIRQHNLILVTAITPTKAGKRGCDRLCQRWTQFHFAGRCR
mgnify:CR=1 FL=1